MYKISYQKENHNLTLEISELKYVLESSSEPELSPNKDYVAIITPFEWECQGEIRLINLKTGSSKRTELNLNANLTPKHVIWKNANTLFVLIGSNWGTVDIGGHLYSYNIDYNELTLLKKFDDTIQIQEIQKENDNLLILRGIKYIDDNFNESEPYSTHYTL
ncbi:DUF4652 domain-containing protein [Planococcus shenhongbingii]|uniref:DUF4652 domain-containing protein n=1 Tax=Planococcus shenhongbingii TaxID=3058398 RepID=UPI00260F909E|nr:DUF4652 domain-containing protein [Planococcus sp. N016]WKA60328.1 DUF4652 domain-containing protein [Planococcus sp. N016]